MQQKGLLVLIILSCATGTDMAASFAGQFGLPSWGRALGLLHDKGKERAALYSSCFGGTHS